MGFFDTIVSPNSNDKGKKSKGFFDSIISSPKAASNYQLKVDAAKATEEATKANSFGGILKETALDVGNKFKTAGQVAKDTLVQSYDSKKFQGNIEAGAKDIQNGNVIKGILKSGGRTAGDFTAAVFAPISAALSGILSLSGGQKLIDHAGEIIADKTGITDKKKFQEFAMQHPNAGEDFQRILNLATIGAEGKTKIDPIKLKNEVISFTKKITSQASEIKPPTPAPQPQATGFFDSIQKPDGTPVSEQPGQTPIIETASPNATRPFTPNEPGQIKQTGLSQSVEARAVEKKLTDGFGGLSEYQAINMADQAKLSLDLVKGDIEKAKRIVFENEEPPSGVKNFSVYVALEKHAEATGDVNLLRDLATKSPLNTEASGAAQTLRILAERDPESALSGIREIQAIREKAISKKLKTGDAVKAKQQVVEQIRSEVKKTAPRVKTWDEFINSIQC